MKKYKNVRALYIVCVLAIMTFVMSFIGVSYYEKEFGLQEFYLEYEAISVPYYPSHDATIVEDSIWAFDKPGDGEEGHEFKVYDMDFNLLYVGDVEFYYQNKDGTESPLEMKSVDYNDLTEELLVGNGSSSYTENDSYLFVFYDAMQWIKSEETIDFSNCGEFTCIDVTDLGIKSYGFWDDGGVQTYQVATCMSQSTISKMSIKLSC